MSDPSLPPLGLALDAMGGDNAPAEIVKGALEAAAGVRGTIFLVGREEVLRPMVGSAPPSNVVIVNATQEVGMDEKPSEAYRKKKDSSLMVAARLVKEGQAQAMISAGNTGAASATSLLAWRQVPGIHRPAIASPMPNAHNGFLLLDAGASPDVDPEHFLGFALMGRAYAQKVMGRPNPKVHLLNIGEEEGKGNLFAKACYKLLSPYPWFAGNIEGKDAYAKPCDIVLCDAFVGNVFLKASEGVAELIVKIIRDGVPKNPILRLPYLPLRKILAPLRKRVDYAEVGGSPLLGLNHLCTICHGRSNAKAIRNAILQTQTAVENNLVETIRLSVAASVLVEQSPIVTNPIH